MKKWLTTHTVTQVLFLQAAVIFQDTAEVLMCTCQVIIQIIWIFLFNSTPKYNNFTAL